jgi:hypothetical protein
MKTFLRPALLFLLLAYALQYPARAQEQEPAIKTYMFPHAEGPGAMMHMVGLSTAKLPEDVVETDDVIRAPLFMYNLKYGLPEHFNIEGSATTNIVTYHISVGPTWSYNTGRWGLSVGTDLAYWFGQLKQFGFNTSYTGWIVYPNLSAGYAFDNFSLTAKAEVVLNLAETSKNGENEVSNNADTYNGYTVGLYLEQPLWKDHFVVIGVRATYLKFYYPMWAAFSTFDRAYYIPEFTFKFIL